MQIKLDTSRLDHEMRSAVYAALFKAAYADDELHRDEIAMITGAIVGWSDQSQIEQAAIREVFRQTRSFEDCLATIQLGPGDLPLIVFALIIDVALADGKVTATEMAILRSAYESLVSMRSDIAEHQFLGSRLLSIQRLRAEEHHDDNDEWLARALSGGVTADQSRAVTAVASPQESILLDPKFQDLIVSIQHRKRQRAAASTLRRFDA